MAKNPTLEQVGALLRSQLGYSETPVNRTKFAAWANHANGLAWCLTFLVGCFRRLGAWLPTNTAYTPTMADAFKRAGRWHSKPKVGDFMFVHYSYLGRIGHVGWVERVEDDGRQVVCIEGNSNAGGSRTGGGVARVRRRVGVRDSNGAKVAGFGRPKYAPERSKKSSVRAEWPLPKGHFFGRKKWYKKPGAKKKAHNGKGSKRDADHIKVMQWHYGQKMTGRFTKALGRAIEKDRRAYGWKPKKKMTKKFGRKIGLYRK